MPSILMEEKEKDQKKGTGETWKKPVHDYKQKLMFAELLWKAGVDQGGREE